MTYDEWFRSQQGTAYDGSYSFAKAAWKHQADRIEALEQLAKDMLSFIESFGHKPGCRKNAFADVCSCGVDKALSRYREVCGGEK